MRGIGVPGEELAMVHLQIIKLAKDLFNIWNYKKSSTFWGSAEWGVCQWRQERRNFLKNIFKASLKGTSWTTTGSAHTKRCQSDWSALICSSSGDLEAWRSFDFFLDQISIPFLNKGSFLKLNLDVGPWGGILALAQNYLVTHFNRLSMNCKRFLSVEDWECCLK